MKRPRTLPQAGSPLYRVVRAGWADPLDASFSRKAPDRRWNTAEFAALYCCGSVEVARAITRDLLGISGLEVDDLQPAYRPRLVELAWTGEVVDIATAEGVAAAGFPPEYPDGVGKDATRRAATAWHRQGREGVVCRSASLWRLGLRSWAGSHLAWSELALFVERCRSRPVELGRRDDRGWLLPG